MMFNIFLKPRKRRYLLIGAGVLGLFFVILSAWLIVLERFGHKPGPYAVRMEISIEKGSSPRAIAKLLQQEGLTSSAKMFYWYLRYIDQCATCLKAGEYIIDGNETPANIIAMLKSGRQREYRFTIPEGARKEDIARIIAGVGLSSEQEVLEAMHDPALMYAFGIPVEGAAGQNGVWGGMEGYLFPDTYQFPKGTPVKDMLWRMRQRLDDMFDTAMRERMRELGFSLHQVLTMASLVEKETASSPERPLIAGVFYNRLARKMKLQTDPTSVYGTSHQGIIRGKQVRQKHDYNTYHNYGLPPGPIASPGLASIQAVLWPTPSLYLFFVSKGNGTHLFCESYGCHQRGVGQYQKRRSR